MNTCRSIADGKNVTETLGVAERPTHRLAAGNSTDITRLSWRART